MSIATDGYRKSPNPEWDFSDRLRKVRRDIAGMTQTEMATELGVKQKAYAAWESGQNRPDDIISIAKRIAFRWRGRVTAIIAAVVFFGGCAAMIGGFRDNHAGSGYTTSRGAPTSLSDDEIDDASFIGTLDMFSVPYGSRADAIDQAKALCLWYQANDSFFEAGALQIMKENAGYTAEDAGHFAGAATAVYCPQYGPKN